MIPLYGTTPRSVYMYVGEGCYTRVIFNGKLDFGKLTAINFKEYQSKYKLTGTEEIYLKYKEWFEYLRKDYDKFKVIWNLNINDNYYGTHKHGDLYDTTVNKHPFTWNLVCHHLGSYRRYGYRIQDDSWKLGVKGLNVQEFRKLKKLYE